MSVKPGPLHYLADVIGTTNPQAVPLAIDDTLSNYELDELLADADVIVAATGDPVTQRRLGERALALDIPAVFPALAEGADGEVFVQLGPSLPCFFCWQGFREADAGLHEVAALDIDVLPTAVAAAHLTLGLIDGDSEYANRLRVEPGQPQPQLFVWSDMNLAPKPVTRREPCPACAVGPSPLNPEAREAWQAARQARPLPAPATVPLRRASPAVPTPVAVSAPTTHIGSELALFLLCVLGAIAPIAIILSVAATSNLNNPNFAIAMLGFACTIIFWISAIASVVMLVRMSWAARAIAAVICGVGAVVIWGIAAAS